MDVVDSDDHCIVSDVLLFIEGCYVFGRLLRRRQRRTALQDPQIVEEEVRVDWRYESRNRSQGKLRRTRKSHALRQNQTLSKVD